MTTVYGRFFIAIALSVFLGTCQEAKGHAIKKNVLLSLTDNRELSIGEIVQGCHESGSAGGALLDRGSGGADGGDHGTLISWQDGGGGLQAESPAYAPFSQTPSYQSPSPQGPAPPAFGQPQGQSYEPSQQGAGRPYEEAPFSGPAPYQGGESSPYNTGIQYAQQYPPLSPQGQSGFGYGGAVQPQGEPPYQGNYSVPPSNYYQSPYGGQAQPGGPGQIYSQRQIIAPAGLVLPVSLQTAISTQVAKPGDYIQASLSQNVSLGGRGYIPAGTQVVGTVSDSTAGRRLSRSGELSLQFNSLRLPNGQQLPITAHLVGDLGKYKNKGTGTNDVYRGEGWGTKLGQTALRGGGGAGLGAGLGTALGAIAGGGHGAGMGAWSGAAIGGGLGVADMFLRKGKDVIIPTGTEMQVQLDQDVDMGGGAQPMLGQSYSGSF
ncbi:MAG: hypothetical protein K2X93_17615 [Candidatus Obscuribacterales bacterium]|nr:hypothetical protein [Candidatus Obscuribacterales bacterium]